MVILPRLEVVNEVGDVVRVDGEVTEAKDRGEFRTVEEDEVIMLDDGPMKAVKGGRRYSFWKNFPTKIGC